MELSKRLKAVADMVNTGGGLLDIGTDHGYLPVFLLKTGKIKRASACDKSPGSLSKAEENIAFYGLDDRMKTVLTDGLSGLSPLPDDVIVMAGMGGLLMSSILQEWEAAAKSADSLVLQPQSHIPELRKNLHKLGFCITDENIVLDGKKYYFIIKAKPGTEIYTEKEYFMSKVLMNKNTGVYRDYLRHKLKTVNYSIENIDKNGVSFGNEGKKSELIIEKTYIGGFLDGCDYEANNG